LGLLAGVGLVVAVLGLYLFAGMPGSATAAQGVTPATLVVADERSLHHLNLYVANDLGLFKKHGLDVRLVEARDPAAVRDLVLTGQADIFWSCPSVAVMAIAQGAPLKIIAQAKTPCGAVLVVPKGSPVRGAADFTGRRFAGPSANCEGVLAYQGRARAAGGEFGVVVESASRALVDLATGKVDGAILEEPHLSLALGKGFRPVLKDVAAALPCRTINARTGILQERPAALLRFVQATAEANAWLANHKTGPDVQAIAERYTSTPSAILPKALSRLKFSDRVDEARIKRLAEEMRASGLIRENPKERLYAAEFKGVTWAVQ
jgi:NitT/TauT family transport system substrate-binding protein